MVLLICLWPRMACPTKGRRPKLQSNNLKTSLIRKCPKTFKNNQKGLKTIPKWFKTVQKTQKWSDMDARPPFGPLTSAKLIPEGPGTSWNRSRPQQTKNKQQKTSKNTENPGFWGLGGSGGFRLVSKLL